MPLIQAVVLAVVQGLTEFLPISSSAHLVLFPWFAGWQEPGLAFNVALHIGTLFAVLIYFLRDWVQLTLAGFGIRASANMSDDERNPIVQAFKCPYAVEVWDVKPFAESDDISLEKTCKIVRAETPYAQTYDAPARPK